MLRATLKGLVARKLRLGMSAFAIVLGVAFVAGTLIFTDTLDRSFREIVTQTVPDVTVRPTAPSSDVANSGFSPAETRTVSAALVDRISEVDGVARVDGSVSSAGVFVIGSDGKVVGTGGAPGLGVNWHDGPAADGSQTVKLVDGREPRQSGEVAIDEKTAEKAGYSVGDQIDLVTSASEARVEAVLTGIVKFGESGNLVGSTLTIFDTATAQDMFLDGRDEYTDVAVTATNDSEVSALNQRISAVLPPGYESITGADLAEETQSEITEALSFFDTFLLIFAGVSLVVGTFLILNTFSILVAQRTRELALLRALGASRRQITRSVLVEALVTGVVGATGGLLLGVALAVGLKALFAAIGLDLSNAGLVFQPRTALVAYLVGILVTIVAAYLPARRAARVSPMAALRDELALPRQSLRRRTVLGTLLTVAGIGAMTAGLLGSGGNGAAMVALGMYGVLFGVIALGPVVAPPILRGLSVGYTKLFGTVGKLARENALRNPRRTAATASALMIGLTLVSTMAVLGESTKRSIDALLETNLKADYVVSNVMGMPFSTAVADEVGKVDGIDTVAEVRLAPVAINGKSSGVTALDPTKFAEVAVFDITEGSSGTLGSGDIMVGRQLAKANGWSLGDSVELTWPAGPKRYQVVALFEESPIVSPVVMTLQSLQDAGFRPADNFVYMTAAPAADHETLRADLDAALASLPTVTLSDQAEFVNQQRASIDQLVMIVYALLGLAIIIAILGIINTLALSVIERTREVGLLRAVGVSRRQLRTMIRLESIVVAALGAVMGVGVGLAFGVSLQRAIADQGIEVLGIPYGQLLGFVVVAALVGILAAVWPARRAARMDVLDAIAME